MVFVLGCHRRGRRYTSGMAKFRGKVKRSDLEGGHWQLVADDGTTYVLEGATKGIEIDGASVEIDGVVERDVMSFAMTGPTLTVKASKTVA
jgi:hypothetical protein